jgi:hypothetical protein
MPTVQPITTLNIDNVSVNVADLSPAVQNLVGVYNEWNQDFADAQQKAAQLQAALNDLSRQIIVQIKKEEEDKKAAEAAPAESTAKE